MKPLHSNFTKVGLRNRCVCCATKWAKSVNGSAKYGNKAARQHNKREVNKALNEH